MGTQLSFLRGGEGPTPADTLRWGTEEIQEVMSAATESLQAPAAGEEKGKGVLGEQIQRAVKAILWGFERTTTRREKKRERETRKKRDYRPSGAAEENESLA